MKKTVITLAVITGISSASQAYTFVDNQETGTKLEFLGSARLKWTSTSDKADNYVDNTTTREHVNQAVRNNSSRFGFRINQQIGQGFYALGRVEWRFRGTSSSQHDFDDIYARQLYAGIGHKQYGELTYGNQTTITDEVKQTDLANTLSLSDGLLNSAARRSIQYVYKGIEGLKVGGYYGGSSKRGNNGLDLANLRKDVWGVGAIYKHKLDELQTLKIATGITRERSHNPSNSLFSATAYSFGTAYTFDKTTLGVDLERKVTKDQGTLGNKRTQNEVRTIALQQLTSDWAAYTMYAYKTNKLIGHSVNTKAKAHQFMLGTEYYIVPKHLKAFVEWQTSQTKNYTSGVKTSKVRNNQTVIGVRAYW